MVRRRKPLSLLNRLAKNFHNKFHQKVNCSKPETRNISEAYYFADFSFVKTKVTRRISLLPAFSKICAGLLLSRHKISPLRSAFEGLFALLTTAASSSTTTKRFWGDASRVKLCRGLRRVRLSFV